MTPDAAAEEIRRLVGEIAELADVGPAVVERAVVAAIDDRVRRIARATAAGPRLRTAAEILAEPGGGAPEVVVPRLVYAGRSTLLAAREKLGKSTLAAAGMAAVSTGGMFLDDPVERGEVLLVALDEHPADAARRIVRFGGDPQRVHVVEAIEGHPVDGIGGAVELVEPRLVVVDALANVAALAGVSDAHASAGWVPLLAGLNRVIRDAGAALLLLHHSRKSDGSYRDSSAIGASVDAIATMHDDGGAARTIETRARWPASDFTLRLVGEIADEEGALAFELASGELSLDARALLFVEAHPGASSASVRTGVTGRAADVDRALHGLVERGAIEDRGRGGAHAYHAVSPDGPGRGPGRPPPSGESPGGRRADGVRTTSGTGGSSRSRTQGDAIGTTPPHEPAELTDDEWEEWNR